MRDSHPPRLKFARDGHHLVLAAPDGLRIVGVPSMDPIAAVEADDILDYAVFDDTVWVVRGGPTRIESYGLDGEPQTEAAELGSSGDGCLSEAPFGQAGAVWQAGDVWSITAGAGELEVVAADKDCDVAIAVQHDTRVIARGNSIGMFCGDSAVWSSRLSPHKDARAVGGSSLFDGRTVAVLFEAGDQQFLYVVGAREGRVMHKLGLRGITSARFAPRRGYAVLRGGDRKLVAADLRFGKVLKNFDESRDIVDFAVDGAAHHLALVLQDAGGAEVPVYTSYREFMAAKSAGDVLGGGPAVEASEESSEERDARSRLEALASARRARLSRDEEEPDEPDEAPLTVQVLEALSPRPDTELCTRDEAITILDEHLALISSMSERAIAHGWHSGRIAFPDDGHYPFEKEVVGLLGHSIDAAADRVVGAEANAQAAAGRLRKTMMSLDGRIPPLRAMMEELDLSLLAAEMLMIAAAPTLWGDMARLYGILCNDPDRAICDEHLIGLLLGGERAKRHEVSRELDADRPLRRFGLLRVSGTRPRPFSPLAVDPLVIRRLRMDPLGSIPGDITAVRDADTSLSDFVAPRHVLRRGLKALARAPHDGYARVVVRGRLGTGRRTLLAALAAHSNRQLGVIDVSLLGREPRALLDGLAAALRGCVIRGWIACIDGLHDDDALDVGLRDQLRELIRSHAGPIGFRTDWDAVPPIDPTYIQIDLPALSESQRTSYWHDALSRHGLEVRDVDALAARFRVGPGIIERVTAEVRAGRVESTNGAQRDDYHELDDAMRRHMEVRLGSVASRVDRLATWSNVVLPLDLLDSLLELISRIRHRRTVYEEWGFDRKMTSSRGLTVLFQGPPGTGKSMVAGVIAGELGLDLYRVDLSRIMSKWIGETERNLAAVFDAAEDGQAVVLFDEADSLFSKRTEVKSSVDRYANLEVNYLLQRLDTFEGIAVLTTNFGGSIDKAFQRRMSLRLSFPFPDEDLREQLWRVHLPPELPTAGDFDLNDLATKYRLSGGYIRNATLRAAFLAAEEKTPLTQEHLERAIRLEYREMGKLAETGVLE